MDCVVFFSEVLCAHMCKCKEMVLDVDINDMHNDTGSPSLPFWEIGILKTAISYKGSGSFESEGKF